MAVFTRVSGDAQGVNVMDPGRTAGNVIALGLTKSPTVFHISANSDLRTEMVTGGAVETILRAIAIDSTVVAYMVESTTTSIGTAPGQTNANLAVIVEATGANASTLQTRLRAVTGSDGTGNIGAAANVWAANCRVVDNGLWLRWA